MDGRSLYFRISNPFFSESGRWHNAAAVAAAAALLLWGCALQPRRTHDLDGSFTKPQTAAIGLQL
jgi:hypothetical protein